jgi:hypothetical protein
VWSAVVCIVLMQHVNDNVFMEKKSTLFCVATLGACCVCACCVCACCHILFGIFCPYAEDCSPAWLTDCLVGRTSPTSPCPQFGWLPSWISTRFKRWWEWKHLHTPCVPLCLCTIRTDPSKNSPLHLTALKLDLYYLFFPTFMILVFGTFFMLATCSMLMYDALYGCTMHILPCTLLRQKMCLIVPNFVSFLLPSAI